jgi:hypothetical protein
MPCAARAWSECRADRARETCSEMTNKNSKILWPWNGSYVCRTPSGAVLSIVAILILAMLVYLVSAMLREQSSCIRHQPRTWLNLTSTMPFNPTFSQTPYIRPHVHSPARQGFLVRAEELSDRQTHLFRGPRSGPLVTRRLERTKSQAPSLRGKHDSCNSDLQVFACEID